MMESVKILLEDSILSIENTTELFYQQKSEEGYQLLDDTLQILIRLVNKIAQVKSEDKEVPIDEGILTSVLTEAMKAMESKDEVLLSDILEYELKTMLIETKETLN